MEPSRRPPRSVLRGSPWAAAAGLVIALTGPAAAPAQSDFGMLGLDRSRFGSLVSLSTPSAMLFQEADEFVLHRTVVQGSATGDPGGIQVGVYRSGPGLQLDNCGTSAGYVTFTEVKAQGSMAFRCQVFNAVSPGAAVQLDVFRFRAAGTWGIRIGGHSTGLVYSLGFSRGSPAIGSELQDLDLNFGTHTATRFGPAGHSPWGVYTMVGRQRRQTVTAADPIFRFPTDDVHWRITRGPARPTIRHRQ